MIAPGRVAEWPPLTALTLGGMMELVKSKKLFALSRNLERVGSHHLRGHGPLAPSEMDVLARHAEEKVRPNLVDLDLTMSQRMLDRILRTLDKDDPPSRQTVQQGYARLMERIEDELADTLVLRIPKDRSAYYAKTDGFGPEVAARFPIVREDLEEAHTCYAMGRNNAAVYHLMLVLEVGVQALGADLGVPDVLTLTWGQITSQCHAKIKQMPKGPKKVERSEAMAFLDGVRVAWRNETLHPKQTRYNQGQVLDVLTNAKGLMQSLAGFL